MHDTLVCSNNGQVHTFTISLTLRKSCKFAYIKYKADLEVQREEKETDRRVLKQKSDVKKLTNTKKQKTILTNSLSAQWEGLIQEILAADKQKDMKHVSEATALCHGIQQKEKNLSSAVKK